MESQLKEMPEQQRNAMQRRAQQACRAPQKLRPLPRRSQMNGDLRRHARNRRHLPAWLKPTVVVLLSLAVFLTAFSYVLVRDLNDRIAQRGIDISQFQDRQRELVDDYSGRAVNIAILGSDTREGEGNDQYGDPEEEIGMRSDTTIVVHISADRTRLQFVSIPRDTMVEMPVCELPDGSKTEPGMRQFNSAFSAGGGEEMNLASAVACTQRTIEHFTGLFIDEVVVVDFAGFKRLVDALGGVRMCLDEDIQDEKADLDLRKGCQHIDGRAALGLARSRYSTEDGSDISRIGRQQELMMNIVNTAMTKSLLTDLPTLYNFVQSGIETVTTTRGLSRATTVAGLAQSIRAIPTEEYQFVTMPWTPSMWDPMNRVEMAPEAEGVWQALKFDQPFPAGTKVKAADGSDGVVGPFGQIMPEQTETTPSETPTAESEDEY